MRDPIENVTRLQKQLNNLQLENQVLKNILDKAGLSYQNELASILFTSRLYSPLKSDKSLYVISH